MRDRSLWLVAVFALLQPLVASAEEAPMEVVALAAKQAGPPPPLRLAEGLLAEPSTALAAAREAERAKLAALAQHNQSGLPPLQTGFVRSLEPPLVVELSGHVIGREVGVPVGGGVAGRTLGDQIVWGAWVRVAEARRLRLHLDKVAMPPGTQFWVWGPGGETASFGLELRDAEGSLWTPSVSGSEVYVEAQLPVDPGPGTFRFAIDAVAEEFDLSETGVPIFERSAGDKLAECVRSATCNAVSQGFGAFTDVTYAIAKIFFVSGGGTFTCSASLLNDNVPGTFIPYLLTARHCISTASEAASLQAWWDVRPPSCGAPMPSSFPTSNGASLLVSGAATDVSLLRLVSDAPGPVRSFLGWTPAAISHGTTLHRVSHPVDPDDGAAFTQSYSRSTLSTTFGQCGAAPRPSYHYSITNFGGTFGGSSGSPLMLGTGQVVGQLRGACGTNPTDGCDYASNAEIDGAFSQSFPLLQPFLSPTAGACVRNATTACLLGNRFEVKVTWQTASGSGAGSAMSFGGQRAETDQSVFFWFFDPANFEMGVKMVNACTPPFNAFWIFVSGLTNQGYIVTIRDTLTDRVRVVSNPIGDYPTTEARTDMLVGFPCP